MYRERQLTIGPLPKNLDNNLNFSPDGSKLIVDCRPTVAGLPDSKQLAIIDVHSSETQIVYTLPAGQRGIGAPSFLGANELVAIHPLTSGLTYEQTVRGGRIIAADGSGKSCWLDSRDVIAPFTPGALRGGTHKHEPDATGEWIGFTYNDHIMKYKGGSDLRNVGVSKHGTRVEVEADPKGQNFTGESFTVLLTACVDHPKPGSDQFQRAEGDCWIGGNGFANKHGEQRRARAFRGLVTPKDGEPVYDVFLVNVPNDITRPGPLGALQGTDKDYPKPPDGTTVQRLTHTAHGGQSALRGVTGQLRCSFSGSWIAYFGWTIRDGALELQVFVVSPITAEVRQVSKVEGGLSPYLRFAPDGSYIAAAGKSGAIWRWSALEPDFGKAEQLTPRSPLPARDLVISPDSKLIAYNRDVDGVTQVFVVSVG